MQLCSTKAVFISPQKRKYLSIVCSRNKSSRKLQQKQNKFKEGAGSARWVKKILKKEDVAQLVEFFSKSTIKEQQENFKQPRDCLNAAQMMYDNKEYYAACNAYSTALEIISGNVQLFKAFFNLSILNTRSNFKKVDQMKFANAMLVDTSRSDWSILQRVQALVFSQGIGFWEILDQFQLEKKSTRYSKTLKEYFCLTNEELMSAPPIRLTVDHNLSKYPNQDAVELSKQGDKENAMGILLTHIYQKTSLVKEILKLRAKTCLKGGQPFQAAVDITTYLVLQPEYDPEEITFLRAQCLRDLQLFDCALRVIQQEQCSQTSIILLEEAKQLETIIQAKKGLRPMLLQQIQLGWSSGLKLGLLANLNSVEIIKLDKMLDKLPKKLLTQTADSRLQDDHKKFLTNIDPPPQCSRQQSLQYFQAGTLLARIQSKNLVVRKLNLGLEATWIKREKYPWFRRFQQWLKVSPVPPKKFQRIEVASYKYIWQKPMTLRRGSTHVAVNYVDLDFLANADYAGNTSDGPVNVVAIEPSRYSSAKSQVIYQMMLDNAPNQALLQVWYSSAWSEETLGCFRQAATKLLQEQLDKNEVQTDFLQQTLTKILSQKPRIQDLLYFWLSDPKASLKESFNDWIKVHPLKRYGAEFQRKQDLAAVATYFISGRLMDCEYGNPVMLHSYFSLLGQIPFDEQIMQSISEQEIKLDLKSDADVMEAIVEKLLAKIGSLKQRILNKEVIVEFVQGEVEPVKDGIFFKSQEDEKTLLQKIKEIGPQSISWSDAVDYIEINKFHKMLKFCSQDGKTVHYVNSMQWYQDVKGAFCEDYSIDQQQKIYGAALENVRHSSLIYWPPLVHPDELINYDLAQKYYQKWVDKFFQKGGVKSEDIFYTDISPFSCFALIYGLN